MKEHLESDEHLFTFRRHWRRASELTESKCVHNL